MTTMYIAANNAMPRGYFLGDVLTIVKTAWMFVESEPHDHIVLSLHDRDPLNFLWQRFIAENLATVVHDRWPQGDRRAQYAACDERLASRRVKNIPFDTYKELYARLDGGERQGRLCGREKGLGAKNIFGYYYAGQQTGSSRPVGADTFGPGVIDIPHVVRKTGRSVLVAPHEKCHGNAVFTLAFWECAIRGLLEAGVEVTLNDDGRLMKHAQSPLFARTYLPFEPLVAQVASQRLVLSGNSGVGWLAGAVGTPLIAMERISAFVEYSFARCGVESLVEIVDRADPARVVAAVCRYVDEPQDPNPKN